jgi:transposase-like protein
MPQAQLPTFPPGSTEINSNLAFERRGNQVPYFYGLLPVFQHDVNDTKTFHLIVSQFYVNGNVTQAEICRTFDVKSISIKRAVKCYREKGAAGFYAKPKRRGAAALPKEVLDDAQQLLNDDAEISDEAKQLTIKADTLRKAIAECRLYKAEK